MSVQWTLNLLRPVIRLCDQRIGFIRDMFVPRHPQLTITSTNSESTDSLQSLELSRETNLPKVERTTVEDESEKVLVLGESVNSQSR